MYQWTNPGSGTVQLSGSPPAWYRSLQAGPRVLVFDNGRLVDDTRDGVTEDARLELREAAFGRAAAEAEVAASQADSVAALKAAMGRARDDGIDVEAVNQEFEREQAAAAEADIATADTQDVAAQAAALKALIERWDRQQLEQARSLLELLPDTPSTPAE